MSNCCLQRKHFMIKKGNMNRKNVIHVMNSLYIFRVRVLSKTVHVEQIQQKMMT